MNVTYYKEYSNILGRDMEYKVYGDSGRICFAIASQNGHYYDFENFHMIDVLANYIEEGRLQVVCPDSIDEESWSNNEWHPRQSIEQQEKWFQYITTELMPTIRARNPHPDRAIVTGCSMGAVHAGIFFFRRPDLFGTVIALSGTYNACDFFRNYMDDLVYENSPYHFLQNMPEDHFYMDIYRNSQIILCCGQGAWEDELLAGTRALEGVLKSRNIPAWVDIWGHDVNHDWPWWQKQLPYFMDKVMNG